MKRDSLLLHAANHCSSLMVLLGVPMPTSRFLRGAYGSVKYAILNNN